MDRGTEVAALDGTEAVLVSQTIGHDCDELIWQRAGVLAGPLGERLQAGEDCGLIECAQVYYPVLPFPFLGETRSAVANTRVLANNN